MHSKPHPLRIQNHHYVMLIIMILLAAALEMTLLTKMCASWRSQVPFRDTYSQQPTDHSCILHSHYLVCSFAQSVQFFFGCSSNMFCVIDAEPQKWKTNTSKLKGYFLGKNYSLSSSFILKSSALSSALCYRSTPLSESENRNETTRCWFITCYTFRKRSSPSP